MAENEENTENWWYPNYNPKISEKKWLELLHDDSVFNFNSMCMMRRLLDIGGASNTKLAQKYGKAPNSYTGTGNQLAQRIIKETNCENPPNNSVWPVPFLGKGVTKTDDDNGEFIWKLRPELEEALKQMDANGELDKYPLYEKESIYTFEELLSFYKISFLEHWEEEKYKWRAIKIFQDNWNVNAEDFKAMLKTATSGVYNLLGSQNYYPQGMILNFAEEKREATRNMFKNLYDESKDLRERIETFQSGAKEILEEHNRNSNDIWKSDYQTENVISVYLWLKCPDKYYIYKFSEFKNFADKLGKKDLFKKGRGIENLLNGIEFYNEIAERLNQDSEIKNELKTVLTQDCWQDSQLRTLTADFGYHIYKYFSTENSSTQNGESDMKNPLAAKLADTSFHVYNLILNGAPGTGKTFLAKEIATEIIFHKSYEDLTDDEKKQLEIQTQMVQFHPSYDYTDFVEGLRPVKTGDKQVGFERRDGVFKEFCKRALLSKTVNSDDMKLLNSSPTIWKVSLEGTGDNPTRKDCLDNGWIRIGWPEYGDVDFDDFNDFSVGGKAILKNFQHTMQIGDIVLSCWSAEEIDAIGIVTDDYEYRDEGGDYPRYRNVKWLVKNIKENITSINNEKKLVQSTIYKLNISVKDVFKIVDKYSSGSKIQSQRNFIFIIDEINRGELSKIFGELFFSIDPGYRGEKGRIQTQYQNLVEDGDVFKDGFFVPENVYIIGTMNDIDRSVDTMDFAFRRRFAFKEIKTDDTIEMLNEKTDENGNKTGLSQELASEAKTRMKNLNSAISKIEGLNSSYEIGASYFLKLKDFEGNSEQKFGQLWNYHLSGLLREYLRGRDDAEAKLDELKKAYDSKDYRAFSTGSTTAQNDENRHSELVSESVEK